MERVLITGANRGIGLELTRQYLAAGDRVFATCRRPADATALDDLRATHGDRVQIVALDVTDAASIAAAAQAVRAQTDALDILYNNAGINIPGEEQRLATVTFEALERVFRVNAAGPLLVTQAFADLLRAGQRPRLITLTSGLGSIALRSGPGPYAYCASKAALNMIARLLAFDLGRDGVITITLDPGWVKTDMGGRGAQLEPQDAVGAIRQTVARLTPEHNGTYRYNDGSEIAW